MANLQFPSNPTSYRRTGWQIVLMFLMAANYLMDHHPRHLQYKKRQRVKQSSWKNHHSCTCVLTSSHSPDTSHGQVPPARTCHCTSPSLDETPHSSDRKPHGKAQRTDFNMLHTIPVCFPKPVSKKQMSDAWARMRAVTRIPCEHANNIDQRKRKKKVAWDTSVDYCEYHDSD